MSIYTKKGDRGKTSLFDPCCSNPQNVSKNSPKIAALGAIDELVSFLGVTISHSQDPTLNSFLQSLQKDLFTINSILAGASLRFPKSKTTYLEKMIDQAEPSLPPLKNFILPGGSTTASHLQFARALTRAAERHVVALSLNEKLPPEILKYLNRLSDCLFTLSRAANHHQNIPDELWGK